MKQNKGKGRELSDNKNLISFQSSKSQTSKCSLISIVLALFNTKTFKLAMSTICRDIKLCKPGSCQFCLLSNLYMRYEKSKRTIEPVELE